MQAARAARARGRRHSDPMIARAWGSRAWLAGERALAGLRSKPSLERVQHGATLERRDEMRDPAALRAEAVALSWGTLDEVVAKLESAASEAAAEAALLDAVQAGAAASSIVVLLSQPEEAHRRLAIKAGSALCRNLLEAFARSDAALVIQAEQRLALARVLRTWLPLPGAPKPAASPGASLMQALRAQMLAEWSAQRNTRKTRGRAILPGREPRLYRCYTSAGQSIVPDPCAFYRRRAYDTPRASTAEGVSAVWDQTGSQPVLLSAADGVITEQRAAVLRAGGSEPRWRTRWDGRAALFEAGAVERLVRLLPMAADGQDLGLELEATPVKSAARLPAVQAAEHEGARADNSGIKLEGKDGRWRAVRDGETFGAGHRCAPRNLVLCTPV